MFDELISIPIPESMYGEVLALGDGRMHNDPMVTVRTRTSLEPCENCGIPVVAIESDDIATRVEEIKSIHVVVTDVQLIGVLFGDPLTESNLFQIQSRRHVCRE